MNNKSIAIAAAIVAVTMLAGIVATTPITTVYAAESETETELKCPAEGVASGKAIVGNTVVCTIGPPF